MANRTALTIIVSIILTVILISLVNVGTSIIIDEPEYNDFCAEEDIRFTESDLTKEEATKLNEDHIRCYEEYEKAQKPYNQYRYYIFAGIGFILLLVGLFSKENMVQLTGLAAGGILVAEGIVINLQNKVIVFFSLLAILIIFGVVAWRVIKKI
ncbi:hypothetical protein HOA55_04545 [archaeon]|jgi:hypothetical protein|nr:hypothetical protein [archaeon]MBT3577996.1 hypothetical protein [archaeon]MBT6820599.1 hypothetical protein [archaeon]MBT6956534.1 hypothetical protein [archaeon]MBT7025850.1 hypothetical protein [archaeon]